MVTALIPAAGRGARLGGESPKAFVSLAGRPLVIHALRRLAESAPIARAVVAVPASHLGLFRRLIAAEPAFPFQVDGVVGGAQRQASVRQCLEVVTDDCEIVVVHDAARPLVTGALITCCIEAARSSGAAVAGLPLRDTVKRVQDGLVMATVDRDGLWVAQTPQAFHLEVLRAAHRRAVATRWTATDDATLVERAGGAVRLVPGEPHNIKITDKDDLRYAAHLLAGRD